MSWFNTRYPSAAEAAAAAVALAMAELTGGRLLIFHVSCRDVVDALRAAKARGVRAFGELCLAYVTHAEAVYQADPVAAMPFLITPPLRDAGHQQALWQGLADGALDIVSTDHTAVRMVPEVKALELAAYFGLAPSLPPADAGTRRDAAGNRLIPILPPGGVEVRLPLMFSCGVLKNEWICSAGWRCAVPIRPPCSTSLQKAICCQATMPTSLYSIPARRSRTPPPGFSEPKFGEHPQTRTFHLT